MGLHGALLSFYAAWLCYLLSDHEQLGTMFYYSAFLWLLSGVLKVIVALCEKTADNS